MSLTKAERETVILLADDTDEATITTWQRPIITKLKKNPAATLVWESSLGTSRGAQFRLPAHLISFRSKERKGGPGNAKSFQVGR